MPNILHRGGRVRSLYVKRTKKFKYIHQRYYERLFFQIN